MITMINKNVVDDLDGIYFFDKINMRANSANHKNVPKLDLNFLQLKYKKKEEKEKEVNNVSNINQYINNVPNQTNLTKIKMTVRYLIK